MRSGVVGPERGLSRAIGCGSRSELESSTGAGESPVGETVDRRVARVPEYGGARETLSESGGTTLQGYILVRDR